MREILAHISLISNTQQGCSAVGKAITEFHYVIGYADDSNDKKPESFLKVGPDGVAFNEKAKVCAFFKFTGPTDSREGATEQPDWYTGTDWSLDWAQEKDLEKNTKYACHLEFIWWASQEKVGTWTTAQFNFTVGVRGSAIEVAWENRLTRLGVDNKKTRDGI